MTGVNLVRGFESLPLRRPGVLGRRGAGVGDGRCPPGFCSDSRSRARWPPARPPSPPRRAGARRPGGAPHVGAGGQARLRHGQPARERRLVHAALRRADGDLLPRPQHAELPRPRVRGHRRRRRSSTARPTRRPLGGPAAARVAHLPADDADRALAPRQDVGHRSRARDRAGGRALRVADRPAARSSTCSPTRRPATTATTIAAAPGTSALLAWDDAAASAVIAEPRLRRPTSGYAGSASDPRLDLEADMALDRRFTGPRRRATSSRRRARGSPAAAGGSG